MGFWDIFGGGKNDEVVSPELNIADPSEISQMQAVDQEIKKTGVEELPLEKIGGFDRGELKQMVGFARLAGTGGGREPNPDVFGAESDESLIKQGYTIKYVENKEWGTRAAVIMKGDEVSVSFRGTKNGKNVVSDANMILSSSTFMEGRVHQGFYRGFQSLWPGIREEIDAHAKTQNKAAEEMKFNFTGHSMGGAIAKIGAWFVHKEWGVEPENIRVATFGDPRVFDTRQAEEYNKVLGDRTLRVVEHHTDPIPAAAPGIAGYKHVGVQLRVEKGSGDSVHSLLGYAKAIDKLPDNDFVKSDSVSFFYYPSKIMQYLNDLILGGLQRIFKEMRGDDYKGFADNEREARANAHNKAPEVAKKGLDTGHSR